MNEWELVEVDKINSYKCLLFGTLKMLRQILKRDTFCQNVLKLSKDLNAIKKFIKVYWKILIMKFKTPEKII